MRKLPAVEARLKVVVAPVWAAPPPRFCKVGRSGLALTTPAPDGLPTFSARPAASVKVMAGAPAEIVIVSTAGFVAPKLIAVVLPGPKTASAPAAGAVPPDQFPP